MSTLDRWSIRLEGNNDATLIVTDDQNTEVGRDRFKIQAGAWYIIQYTAGERSDSDVGYGKYTLCEADGDEMGDAVAEVVWDRPDPVKTTFTYGEGTILEEGRLYSEGATFQSAPSSTIIIGGLPYSILYSEGDEILWFYSSVNDISLVSGDVEWSIPGGGPETVGVEASCELWDDPMVVEFDWVSTCVGEEGYYYPGQTTDGAVTFVSDDEDEGTGTYVTMYPYQANTLKLTSDGTLLRPGSDFVEVTPSEGKFRIFDSGDWSGTIKATYIRAGDELLSGSTGPSGIYRPPIILQYGWGTRLDGYNCTMACSAMALARHTNGELITTPPQHRANQDDQIGGADLLDVQVAWERGWSHAFQYMVASWDDLVSKIDEGRGIILQGLYGALPPNKRFSTSFTGGHAIYLNERFANGNIWGADPLYKLPCLYTPAELIAYAHSLSIGGEYGRVSFGYTRITT
jgi:hypothetical protein